MTKNDKTYKNLDEQLSSLANSETQTELDKRTKQFYNKIKINLNGDLLIVSHNNFIKTLISNLFKINLIGMGNNYGKYTNTHITSIKLPETIMELQLYNKHLNEIEY